MTTQQLEREISVKDVTEVFSEYDLILPVMLDAVDDEKARKMIGQQMKEIDPEIRLSKIIGTEGSYVKGLMHRRTPDNPYVKEIVNLALEEHKKQENTRYESNSI